MKNRKVTYNNAFKAVQEIITYIESIREVWDTALKLKLYDASYQAGDIIEKVLASYPDYKDELVINPDSMFDDFCSLSYDNFINDMQYEGIEDVRRYIGRTSSFYLTDFHNNYTDRGCRYPYISNITNIGDFLRDIGVISFGLSWIGNKPVSLIIGTDSYSNSLDCDYEDLESLVTGEALEAVKAYFEDAIKIYEYITGFLKDQIELFKDYARNEIEYFIGEIEDGREAEKQEKELFCIDTVSTIIE